MSVFKDDKAQVSLELLILIGAAVVMATAVGFYVKSIPKGIINGN